MREEFLTPRSQFPPFDGIVTEKLPENFDYGKYMQKQLTNFLIEIIEVPVSTWVVIWVLVSAVVQVYNINLAPKHLPLTPPVFTLPLSTLSHLPQSAIFCSIMVSVNDNSKVLVWVWAGFGWSLQLLHVTFQLHLNRTLSMCCNRKYMQKSELRPWFQRLPGTEMDIQVRDDRPGWTSLDLPDPRSRSMLEQCLLKGHVPNRQHLLFPTQVHGKNSNEFLARLYLLCFTVYISLLLFQFLPSSKRMEEPTRLFYLILTIEPLVYYVSTLSVFIQSIVEVNSLRVFKPSTTISTVLRDQKAERYG